ncbi:NAD(P)-binding protein [Cadophora sp. DSE1049]|nr:NAD(P)-binding protein [Cadophora sp. DSE1049]
MAPTILVIGATGNTGKSVVRHLPKLLEFSNASYRILGLTRSLDNPASQKLAKLSHIEMQEKDWTTIDAAWLQSQEVVRVYIAPHNLPHQFVEESALHVALLHAGIKYVVRVSTNVEYVGPTNPVFYGRSHWAIENLLSQPEFKSLQWTSLQPNFFTASYLASTVDWIKAYRKTGKQETLAMVPAADAAVAMIDPEDVGNIGAHLLALEDPMPHNHAKYVLSGPEDVTGKRIVELVEQYLDIKVQNAEFKVTSWLGDLVKAGVYSEKDLPSILAGCEPLWQGKCSLAGTPTSKGVMDLAPPKRTVVDALKAMLEE